MQTFSASASILTLTMLTMIGPSAAQPQTFSVLVRFSGPNGSAPNAGVIRAAGNFYGTTTGGGDTSQCNGFGCGTVFRLNRTGETVLYSFSGGSDGSNPIAGVIGDSAGNLYGTTSSGGAGFGVVFKLDATGAESVLHTFTGTDGGFPHTGVILDSAGNLYGTSSFGGAFHAGLVYKLDSSNSFSILYSFMGGIDGFNPQAGLVRDLVGNLYGTTTFGGTGGHGVVFRLDTNGNRTVLYNFTGGTDGGNPYAGLTFDKAGNLYGTTQGGGDLSNSAYGYGVVYRLSTASYEVLYSFTGGIDGGSPESGVIIDSTGSIYGTTLMGGNLACSINGSVGCGVVYKVDATGTEMVLHTFTGAADDGGYNQANLTRDAAGNLYSTSAYGGESGLGEIFRIKP
jgi:uncharacterized repeat protein (TIGR03803 family)